MHALFMLLAALSALLLLRAMARPRHWWRWAAYALALTATIYTMYFGFLILAAQTAFTLCALFDLRRAASHIAPPAPPQRGSLSLTRPFGGRGGQHGNRHWLCGGGGRGAGAVPPWWPVLLGILRKRAEVARD